MTHLLCFLSSCAVSVLHRPHQLALLQQVKTAGMVSLLVALASCAPTTRTTAQTRVTETRAGSTQVTEVRPIAAGTRGNYRITLSNIIDVFEPTRGRDAVYGVGEEIRFRIRTARDGYVTLTAIDPDGFVYVLGPRNVYVPRGVTTTLPAARDNIRFTAAPPRGFHEVRASFTPSPTDTTVTVYQGRRGSDMWIETIVTEVERYPGDARDIVATSLFIQ